MTLVCPLWGSGAETTAGHVAADEMHPAVLAPTSQPAPYLRTEPSVAYPPWSQVLNV